MSLIKGAFVGEKSFDVIKMHGTTIKIIYFLSNYTDIRSDYTPSNDRVLNTIPEAANNGRQRNNIVSRNNW
jgi:hypothetical protein